ncbi:MAG: endonuclease MutS2, partial [Bacteroidaceae bacterium]|nr:endonuclease MutS2 [Bacteroidaceae bacterium]
MFRQIVYWTIVIISTKISSFFFSSIFIDIGDEQSIADDLSTYSSHLLNMKNMMRHCDPASLLLIDEFGGGTEPTIGGAMAEAVLKRFLLRGTFGVITTHYQNLKHFADEHDGIVNGAMLYDRQQMRALFQLQMGNPGSSFAIEIARKIGLPEDVIADASAIVGKDYINADKYLLDIVRDKRYWESKRQNIHSRERDMEKTIAQYEREIEDLQRKRKDIIRDAKEQAEQIIAESNARVEKVIREIRETQADKERTREARQQLADYRNELAQERQQERDEIIERKMRQIEARHKRRDERRKQGSNPAAQGALGILSAINQVRQPQNIPGPLEAGATCRIKGQSTVGTLEEINGKRAVVLFGVMRTTVELSRLEPATAPQEEDAKPVNTYISRQTQEQMHQTQLNFRQDLDIRGMRADEALSAITYYIDDAIRVG